MLNSIIRKLLDIEREEEKEIDEHFQESALTNMHCQQVKGYSLVLANFIFLPHIPQQQRSTIRHCFFDFMSILLFAAADAATAAIL